MLCSGGLVNFYQQELFEFGLPMTCIATLATARVWEGRQESLYQMVLKRSNLGFPSFSKNYLLLLHYNDIMKANFVH